MPVPIVLIAFEYLNRWWSVEWVGGKSLKVQMKWNIQNYMTFNEDKLRELFIGISRTDT